MSELQQNQKYKVRIRLIRRFWIWFIRLVNNIVVFFSLRRRKKFWGIVYDSITKQPLDPAIVHIAYLGESRVETCVTDLGGNYGFLAHPGKFKILARKTNYTFPSKIALGDHDGIYNNLYHGEFFEMDEDYDVVAPNIPMDPVAFDWNQQAKLSHSRKYPYFRFLFKRLIAIFFWFGFIMLMLMMWGHLGASVYLYGALAAYSIIFLLSLIMPHLRLWGRLKQKVFQNESLLIELTPVNLRGVVMGKTKVTPGGKFLLRANKGHYRLIVKHEDEGVVTEVGECMVTVGAEGVVNQTVAIRG